MDGRDGETDERYDDQNGKDSEGQDDGTADEGPGVADNCEHGCCCADTEGGESDANTTGPPTDDSHVPSLQPLGRDTLRRCHQVVQNMVAQICGGGIPENRIQECVWTVLLAMEGEEEGVATAAIDSSKFFDMIVWEVVFPMMGKMGVPDSVWKLQASFVFHLKRSFRHGQSCGEVWKAIEWSRPGMQPLSGHGCMYHWPVDGWNESAHTINQSHHDG